MRKGFVITGIAVCFSLFAKAQSSATGMAEETSIYEKVFDAPLRTSDFYVIVAKFLEQCFAKALDTEF